MPCACSAPPPPTAWKPASSRDGHVLSQSLLDRLTTHLDTRFGLDALWLFGSIANVTATPASDVDLAALFQRRPTPLELLNARAALGEIAGRDVDLVDLDYDAPILVMQVLRYGRLLLDRNPARRIRLVAGAPARYEDLMIIRRQAERALLDRVRRG